MSLLLLAQAALALVTTSWRGMASSVVPYLSAHGFGLYTDITTHYAPGLLWAHSVAAAVFPDPAVRTYVLTVAFYSANLLLVDSLAQRWWGKRAALLACAHVAVWQPLLAGGVGADGVAGTLCLVALWQIRRPMLAGLALGVAVVFKQTAGLAAVALGAYYAWNSVVLPSVSASRLRSRRLPSVTALPTSSTGRSPST